MYKKGGYSIELVGSAIRIVMSKISSIPRDRPETKHPWYNLFRAVYEMRFESV